MARETVEKAEKMPECIGKEALLRRVLEINDWARREGLTVKYVSGVIALRFSSAPGWPEVLLVRGKSANGVPKEFWQFPGGYEHPEDGGDHVKTLARELNEEMGVSLPEMIAYAGTYIPKPKPGATEVLAIHAFTIPVPNWNADTVTLGSDVNEMEWTRDPFREKNGEPRVLTEQVDYMLRRSIGYSGPINKNTCTDESYDGVPFHLPAI